MALSNPYQQYQKNSIYCASSGELTLMLYNGAIKYINFAINALEYNKLDKVSENLIKAQDIINYLSSTLDMNYDISINLSGLYDFMYRHLVEANINKNVEAMLEVRELVEGLRDAWSEMLKQTGNKAE